MAHVLALRMRIKCIKTNTLPAIVTFIQLTNDFDCVHRDRMIAILMTSRAYDIPKKLEDTILVSYIDTMAIFTNGTTDEFGITTGVLLRDMDMSKLSREDSPIAKGNPPSPTSYG